MRFIPENLSISQSQLELHVSDIINISILSKYSTNISVIQQDTQYLMINFVHNIQ